MADICDNREEFLKVLGTTIDKLAEHSRISDRWTVTGKDNRPEDEVEWQTTVCLESDNGGGYMEVPCSQLRSLDMLDLYEWVKEALDDKCGSSKS